MNLLSFISLIAFFTLLISGVFVFWDDHKSRLHQQYLFLSLALGMYALSYVFIYMSPTKEFAFVWFRVSSVGWTLFPAIFLNLSLILTGRTRAKSNILLQPLLFLPGVVFLFRSFVYSLYAHEFLWFNNYWKFVPDFSSIWLWLFLFYLTAYLGFGFLIIYQWRKNISLNKLRIKGSVILWMIAIGYLISMISNLVLPFMHVHSAPEFAHITCAIVMAGAGFAIVRYKELPIRPETAGEPLFNTTTDMVFITNQQLTILKMNNAASKTLGHLSKEIQGKTINNFINIPPTWLDNNLQANKTTPEKNSVLFLFPKKGGKIPVSLTVQPVFDDTRDLTGYVFLVTDQQTRLTLDKVVEERRELQYELSKAREKANESDKLKSTFLSNISHELRTPLNGILGFAEILKLELQNSSFSEIADHIDRSGNRLLGTLNSIIDLSLIEANKNEIDKQPVDICSLVEQKADIYKKYASSKNLDLHIHINEHPIMSRTDQRLIGHVISNLLDNAIKYTESGNVAVSCKQISTGKRFWAMISVKDSGIGIDKSDFAKIFERFRQSSEGQNRAYEGMGLGLSICKHFVELLDGEIWLESEIGGGSEFYVKIPSYMPEETLTAPKKVEFLPSNSSSHKTDQPDRFRPCVLIVEDEKTNREYMKYLLLESYDVDTSENGISALERAAKFRYDLIFMDVNLNREMTGIEAMKKIREIEHYKTCPIAAVTANVMKNTRDDLLSRGFTHYLAKPFTREQLINLSHEMLK